MKSPTAAGWVVVCAALMLLAGPAPVAGQPQPTPARPTGEKAPSTDASQDAASAETRRPDSAHGHLKRAAQALDDIQASSSLSSRTRASVAELERHVSAIEKTAATAPRPGEAGHGRKGNWSKDLAAAEQVLSKLLEEKLDEATTGKLLDVRRNLSAFAAGMSGGPSMPGSTTSAAAGEGDLRPEEAKQHLAAAQKTLMQIPELPAAAQLSEHARTRLSRVISSFDALMAERVDWRKAYARVESELNALLGGESAVGPSPAEPGTAGRVGSPGIVELEPTIKVKLVEFRAHLNAFEEAAGR